LVKKIVFALVSHKNSPGRASALAKKLDFKESDKVVYPAHGVGSVDSIQTRKVSGSEQQFYMITIIETGDENHGSN
jgi:CarD family transcriptional regulator